MCLHLTLLHLTLSMPAPSSFSHRLSIKKVLWSQEAAMSHQNLLAGPTESVTSKAYNLKTPHFSHLCFRQRVYKNVTTKRYEPMPEKVGKNSENIKNARCSRHQRRWKERRNIRGQIILPLGRLKTYQSKMFSMDQECPHAQCSLQDLDHSIRFPLPL